MNNQPRHKTQAHSSDTINASGRELLQIVHECSRLVPRRTAHVLLLADVLQVQHKLRESLHPLTDAWQLHPSIKLFLRAHVSSEI